MARPKSVNKVDETVIVDEPTVKEESVLANDEEVKVAEPKTEATEKKVEKSGYTVVSVKRAGKTIVAVTGKAIKFNLTGVAENVDLNDAVYLKNLPDVEVKGL